MKLPQKLISRKKGFTLTEVMVALSIFSTISYSSFLFIVDTNQMLYRSQQKILINKDIRTLTIDLTQEARFADAIYLYDAFDSGFRTPDTDGNFEVHQLENGRSGDCLVFVQQGEDTTPLDDIAPPLESIVCFYRTITDIPNSKGPVIKIKIEVPVADQYKEVEELIPSTPVLGADGVVLVNEVLEFSVGLANGNLFYRFDDSSIMVNGIIDHSNDAKRVTDTYNFTISKRRSS